MASDALNNVLRAGYAQLNRIAKLDTPLGEDWFVPLYIKINARLGRNFDVIVDVASTRNDKVKLSALMLQPVTLWIQQTDGQYLPIHGYVQRARRIGNDGGVGYFQIHFSSWLGFLKLSSDRRDWQEARGQDILADVFGKHPQAQGTFRFDLRAPIRSYSHRVQWETDWNFVHRSMEESGVFPRFDFATDGKSHTVVISDDLYFGPQLPQRELRFSRSGANEEFNGFIHLAEQQEAQSATLTTITADYKRPDLDKLVSTPAMNVEDLPGQGEDYIATGSQSWSGSDMGEQQARIRIEEWASRAKRYFGVGSPRYALPGYWFKLSDHPDFDRLPEKDRELSIIASDWLIQNNLPGMDALSQFPQSLRAEVERAKASGVGAQPRHSDGGVGFVYVEVEAQCRHVPFRSPFEHRKPEMHLQTGIVGAPDKEEIHTDDGNRVKVWMTYSRKSRDEKASAWIRAAMPDAGARRGGYFPLRKGDQVLVGFVNGDCDRPVVISRLHGGETMPVWHTHGVLSGLRSREYGGDGFNQLVLDDSSGQNRAQLYTTSYASHLHLGYLIEHSENKRGVFVGSGFDLKSEAHGAIRAVQGLSISTHPAAVQPMDVSAATDQLAAAETVFDTVSQASETNRAESLKDGSEALKAFTEMTQHSVPGSTKGGRTAGGGTGNASGFAKPALLLSSPAGVGFSTQQSIHASANQQVNLVSGKNVNLAAGKSLLASVMDKISLFAQNLGIKIFATKGPIEIQAQNDALTMLAQLDVKIESASGRMILRAEKELILNVGGSYIKITPDMIENGTSGQILEKCASWDKPGASAMTLRDPVHGTPVSKTGGYADDFSG